MVDVILLLKLTLVPALILVASLVGIRWGPAVSGWLVSLPLTSAPVVFFLALEQGDAFASKASGGVILGLASITAFALAYSWLAMRKEELAWYYPMLLGWGAFFLLTFLLDGLVLPQVGSFAGVVLFLALANVVLPRPLASSSNQPVAKWEILVRMIAATVLVLFITEASTALGAQLSGLLTPFPVYVSVMAASAHRLYGAPSAVQLVRGATLGLFTPAIFFLIVGGMVVGFGVAVSFGLAIVASLLVHGLSFKLLRRRATDSRL